MGKTFTVRKSATAQIVEQKMTPTKAAPVGAALDATVAGTTLAAECFATLRAETGKWVSLAHRIIEATHDVREVFLKAVAKELQAMRDENAKVHGVESKDMRSEIASATVQISKLQRIARAAQKGFSLKHAADMYGIKDGHNIGMNRLQAAAGDYLKAVAAAKDAAQGDGEDGEGGRRGRDVSPIVVKLHKWLDRTVESQEKSNRTAETERLDSKTIAALRKIIADLEPVAAE